MHKSDVFKTAQLLPSLYMLYFALFLAATIMGYKLVSLGPMFTAPGSGLIFTFTFFLGSIITEVYGFRVMRRLIWLTIIYATVFVLIVSALSLLPTPAYWHAGLAYGHIILHVFHFSVAGGLGFLVSAFVNAYLISKSKIKYKGAYFWLRSFIAAALSELVANGVSLLITFFGDWNVMQTLHVFAHAYLYKLAYGVIGALLASFLVVWIKKAEHLNVYDNNIAFHPFKMSL